jgi:plasmid stabilization system protein ParE
LLATPLNSVLLRRPVNIRIEYQPNDLLGRFRLNESETQLIQYPIIVLAIETYKSRLRLVYEPDELYNRVEIARSFHEQQGITSMCG